MLLDARRRAARVAGNHSRGDRSATWRPRAPIVRPVRGEEHGHPVLIDRSLFGALRAADPSTGAKPIVREHVSPAGDVVVDDDGAFIDIDTPEEYARVLGHSPS